MRPVPPADHILKPPSNQSNKKYRAYIHTLKSTHAQRQQTDSTRGIPIHGSDDREAEKGKHMTMWRIEGCGQSHEVQQNMQLPGVVRMMQLRGSAPSVLVIKYEVIEHHEDFRVKCSSCHVNEKHRGKERCKDVEACSCRAVIARIVEEDYHPERRHGRREGEGEREGGRERKRRRQTVGRRKRKREPDCFYIQSVLTASRGAFLSKTL